MIGEEGVEQLLIAANKGAVSANAIKPPEFKRVIVDSDVMKKAIAHPTDSRLLKMVRYQVVMTAKAEGITLEQIHAEEQFHLRRKTGSYAHARQYKQLRKVEKRKRNVRAIVLREIQRKRSKSPAQSSAVQCLTVVMPLAERLRTQKTEDKDKLYDSHAREVSCINKVNARKPYDFGVKSILSITNQQRAIIGGRKLHRNHHYGHTLTARLDKRCFSTKRRNRTQESIGRPVLSGRGSAKSGAYD